MYKTVRKGDASLQYTIVPQTDQFTTNELPLKSLRKNNLRLIIIIIISILIFISGIFARYWIKSNKRNVKTPTLTLTLEEANTNREMSLIVSKIFSQLNCSREKNLIQETSTQSESSRSIERQDSDYSIPDGQIADAEDKFISDSSLETNRPAPIPSTTFATNFRKSLYSTLPLTASSILSSSVSSVPLSTPASSLSSSTFATSSLQLKPIVKGAPLKQKMPRVTLKLRENETIPQMYINAGIASYKKGNITTSVLARGLSLEHMIFKTPEGTIKPWPQKWPFEWMPSDPRWQGTGFTLPMLHTIFSILGALVGLLCFSSVVLLLLLRLRLSQRKRPEIIKEPEVEGPNDKSTLLGVENQERIDRE